MTTPDKNTSHAWRRGQRILRDMGIAGGHWIGTVALLPGDNFLLPDETYRDERGTVHHELPMPDGRMLVSFGADRCTGVSIGFDVDDPHLKPAPDDLSAVAASDQSRRDAHARSTGIDLDKPLWPAGYFGSGGPS